MFRKRTGNGVSTENILTGRLKEQPKTTQHLVDCFEKETLTTFPKYKCNVKYNDTTTSRSISSEGQHNWLIPRLSSRLKKQLANTNPIEINKFSSLIKTQHLLYMQSEI